MDCKLATLGQNQPKDKTHLGIKGKHPEESPGAWKRSVGLGIGGFRGCEHPKTRGGRKKGLAAGD